VTCGRAVVFSVYSTNKTDCHDITEILLKVAVNAINQPLSAYTKVYNVFIASIYCTVKIKLRLPTSFN
jgi:hypothetical protein